MDFVIGDIHSEFSKLKKLINAIEKEDSSPHLIFIGDYIDKGENAQNTLDYLLLLQKKFHCTFLIGNHEYTWLTLKDNPSTNSTLLNRYGAQWTIQDFGQKTYEETLDCLLLKSQSIFNSLKLFYRTENYFICHSGLMPQAFNKKPESLQVNDLILNRYDFLSHMGHYMNKIVIFGHTAFYSVYYDGFKIGLDTGACYQENQPLTAFCLSKNKFIDSQDRSYPLSSLPLNSSPAIIRLKPYRNKGQLNEIE